MSDIATAWAWAQKLPKASLKLVLLCLAEHHNRETDVTFPSTTAIVEETGLDRKTVQAAISWLRENGFLTDTGRRVGRTKQVIVYRLESVPKMEQFRKRNSSDFPEKEAQNSQETGPKTGHGISKESLRNLQEGERVGAGWLIAPDWKPPEEAVMQARRAGVPQSVIDDPKHLSAFILKYREAPAKDTGWSMRYVNWLVNETRGRGRGDVPHGTTTSYAESKHPAVVAEREAQRTNETRKFGQ